MKLDFQILYATVKDVIERNGMDMTMSHFPIGPIGATIIREYCDKVSIIPNGELTRVIEGMLLASWVLNIADSLKTLTAIQYKMQDVGIIFPLNTLSCKFEFYNNVRNAELLARTIICWHDGRITQSDNGALWCDLQDWVRAAHTIETALEDKISLTLANRVVKNYDANLKMIRKLSFGN